MPPSGNDSVNCHLSGRRNGPSRPRRGTAHGSRLATAVQKANRRIQRAALGRCRTNIDSSAGICRLAALLLRRHARGGRVRSAALILCANHQRIAAVLRLGIVASRIGTAPRSVDAGPRVGRRATKVARGSAVSSVVRTAGKVVSSGAAGVDTGLLSGETSCECEFEKKRIERKACALWKPKHWATIRTTNTRRDMTSSNFSHKKNVNDDLREGARQTVVSVNN